MTTVRSFIRNIFIDDDDTARAWFIVTSVTLIIILGCTILSGIVNHVSSPAVQADIEQYSIDLAHVDVCDTDTRNDIIRLNLKLRRAQKYNSIVFFDVFFPDSWDKVKPIPIDNTRCYQKTVLIDGLPKGITIGGTE